MESSSDTYQQQQQQQQQQLQQQLTAYSSLATQSARGSNMVIHDWNPSIMMNGDDYNGHMNLILPNSKESYATNNNTSFIPLLQNTLFQDTNGSIFGTSDHVKFKQQNLLDHQNGNADRLSSSFSSIGHQLLAADSYANLDSADRFASSSHAYVYTPSPDYYSNVSLSPSLVSTSSPGLNLSMDNQACINSTELSSRQLPYTSYCQIQKSRVDSPSNSSNKETSASRNGGLKAKRQVNFTDVKPSHEEAANKKSRAASTLSSSSALKVRKEKLGDRIAALHRLVAPFGKTDTASVLTEAIGYIQFLQDQIQTLSTSYVKSSRRRRLRGIPGDPSEEAQKEDQPMQNLRSRGLCLVPLSITSYMSACNGDL